MPSAWFISLAALSEEQGGSSEPEKCGAVPMRGGQVTMRAFRVTHWSSVNRPCGIKKEPCLVPALFTAYPGC